MRKGKTIFILLAIMAVTAAGMARDHLNRTVILLKSGRVIPVDRIWEAGTDLFYENEREIHFVSLAEIKAIEKQSVSQVIKTARGKVSDFFIGCATGFQNWSKQCFEYKRRAGETLWPVMASVTAGVILFCGIRLIRARWLKTGTASASSVPPDIVCSDLPDRTDLVHYFLNLYRHQLGAGPEAPAEFVQIAAASSGPERVYELRVKSGGDWVKRRMTIGPIGEDSGSRSKCYYVIFDRHLVVKIPSKPIVDFEHYISGIKKEGHIVEQLAPRQCIVPNVSVILSQIDFAAGGPFVAGLPADLAEEKFIAWLRKNPEYHDYLKIKGTFVFFMDLSRYYFLGQILDDLHAVTDSFRAEIASTHDLIRYPAKFKDRYGVVNEAVGYEIRDLFNQCEAEIRQLLKASGNASGVTSHQIQAWFIRYLEKNNIGGTESGFPADLTAEVTAIFSRLFEKYRASVTTYLETIKRFTKRLSLEQNRLAMSGVVTHLLELLAWLHEKRVALRDLKPDNLLVAGDPQRYPAFLRSPLEYSLGFIDVETAVYLGKTGDSVIKQPLLGGTPYYATPSHLFPNAVLSSCFNDTARILHFQDWQAVLVMVYKIVTGELLFERTARLFADVKAKVLKAMRQGAPLADEFREASRSFWQSAGSEFRSKVKANESSLRRVEIEIPQNVYTMFTKVLQNDMAAIEGSIRSLVGLHAHFFTRDCRKRLLRASYFRVCQIQEEVLSNARSVDPSPESIRSTRRFLQNLVRLKALSEGKRRMLTALRKSEGRTTVYDIAILMFHCTSKSMWCEDWKTFTEKPACQACSNTDELSLATVV